METEFGYVEIGNEPLQLGELLVTDDGVEIEVVSLNPLRFEEAPIEDEDWGE
jgi:lysine biosynthesis protein LysW